MNAPAVRTRLALGLAAIAVAALGCTPSSQPAPAEAPPDATYVVRAEVVRLPAAPGGELYLRHESIPTFRDSKGNEVGMMSMTMPFAAPAGLDLAGVAAGDRVEATFEVRWSTPRMPLRVTRLAPLPPGTPLEFDEPAEPAAETAGQPAGETPR